MPASFDLTEMQSLIVAGRWAATWDAQAHAISIELDAEADIKACVLALDDADFYKTMQSTVRRGTFQDVYKTTYAGHRIYLKLRLQENPRKTVVIQFKKDQSK